MSVYKDEKRGTWYSAFHYTDWTGSSRQAKKRGFATKREAQEYEAQFKSKIAASPDMTFQALYDLYMEDCKTRLRPTTYAGKEFLIKSHVLPYFKDKIISQITAANIRQWQNKLMNTTFEKKRMLPNGKVISNQQKYTQTYLKTVHNQVSAMFNYACKYYHLSTNPARICGSMGKKKADSMKFWTLAQFNEFIDCFEPGSLYYAAFSVLFWTGCRCGELLALTPKDFDFKNKTVTINKSYTRLNRHDLIQAPKTPKSIRTIAIPPFLVDIVKKYMDSIYEIQPDQRLFEITKHGLTHQLKYYSDYAGVPIIRIHDLRHSHASLLIEQGLSPILIKERLGHENIETTLDTYSHLYPNKQSELSSRLQSLWKSGGKKGKKK